MRHPVDLLYLIESFEKEINRNVKSINLDRVIDRDIFFIHNSDSSVTYKDPGTQLLWRMYFSGFNKAKRAIKINLPPLKQNPENFYDAGFNEGVEECRKHINAQQIKTR
ncbi:hypothetical protein L3033_004255 [Providencia stuartii]|uniref:hypothetical protein n=1 Tax=Providencia stuartii TaxID=588 RepID=UPI0023B01ECD|nr:hypothetical protein [Providencia thailandensis]MDE8748556.1 hypothetical protein [Providencia thailandensis]MDE8767875.1 hypothetical protein [Providencia thailandensis]MDE8780357.1 hypothetical protein [Providencia thailandensis]MDE8784369.1 hypothetical protein [Providencia thailandensis]MDE8788363.1 hypothetical protein [Providencia thailandensis]